MGINKKKNLTILHELWMSYYYVNIWKILNSNNNVAEETWSNNYKQKLLNKWQIKSKSSVKSFLKLRGWKMTSTRLAYYKEAHIEGAFKCMNFIINNQINWKLDK